jgi:pimeloyl-ACP methyl ester carboxylesterase
VRAVTDLIDAYGELSSSGEIQATGNDTLYLIGYSQGGGATMSVFEALDNNANSDLIINAVSCGAGAYDLTDMAQYVFNQTTFPIPLYFPYFIYSQKQMGTITGDLGLFFSEPYASAIPGLFDGLHSSSSINESLSENISELFTSQLSTNFAAHADFAQLRSALEENSTDGWNTDTKLRLYHGTADLNVPIQQSEDIYDRFIDAGSDRDKVELVLPDGLNHETALIPWGIATINWLNTLEGK